MPALPADIGAASRDVVVEVWASAAIAARYPSSRDGSVQPADGFFDTTGDAHAVITARGALLGNERRRFTVQTAEIAWPDISTGLPQARLIDRDGAVDDHFFVSRIELDLDTETTTYELFGGMSAPDAVVIDPVSTAIPWILAGGAWYDVNPWDDTQLWQDS